MGEIADMMIEGSLCGTCGEHLGNGDGFPAYCPGCEPKVDNPQAAHFEATRPGNWDKRAKNRQQSAALLTERGIDFEPKNDGAHLIVKHNALTVDFWPGTGKYIVRGGETGRGVFNLLKLLENIL